MQDLLKHKESRKALLEQMEAQVASGEIDVSFPLTPEEQARVDAVKDPVGKRLLELGIREAVQADEAEPEFDLTPDEPEAQS